ncbi:PqqD family peptide modification chaperone [Nocardia sp. NPDC004068]|uniref:PqqD family peptide modification chaperone n=1 Tax=Nocardia sp. NPDC004068 TaxID=3364303 RepID=UPI0036953A79
MRIPDHINIAETNTGLVLLHGQTGTYWEINQTGRMLIEAIRRSGQLDELPGRIAAEFDVDSERAEADLHAVLTQLVAEGLIEK